MIFQDAYIDHEEFDEDDHYEEDIDQETIDAIQEHFDDTTDHDQH
jgi:hypothetical protein